MVTGGGAVPAAVPCGGGGPATLPQMDTSPRRSQENRRSNKPIMEKRRRARINNCLNELKSLILDAMKKDPARHSKLEKADILEMTVKHLETMQRQQLALSAAADPQVLNKFRAGFSECAGEVGRFPGLEPPVRRRLLQHLANCLSASTNAADPPPSAAAATATAGSAPPQGAAPVAGLQVHIVPAVEAAQLTTANGVLFSASGLQLVPTRLPNGDIALVLPSSGAQILRHVAATPAGSPAPSAASASPPPLLLPTPRRAASAGSSSSSPVAFERLTVSTSTDSPSAAASPRDSYPSPVSPSSSTASYDVGSASGSDLARSPRPFSPPLQSPLSLVVKKSYDDVTDDDDERPWRPW